MDIGDIFTNNFKNTQKLKTVTWSTDSNISALTGDIFSHISSQKKKAADASDLISDSPDYRKPQDHIGAKEKISQRIRFNLIWHRGAHSDTKALDLFK